MNLRGTALPYRVTRVGIAQREVAELVLIIDGQIDREDPVVIGHGEVVRAIGGPSEVDWSVADRLVRVVNQPRLDRGVLPTVQARDVVQLEVGGSNHGDVDVRSGRGQYGSLVSSEVVVRVSEVSADAEDPGRVLRIPSPVVVERGLTIDHLRHSCEAGLLRTCEYAVAIDVDLERHRVVGPSGHGSVPHGSDYPELLASEHLRHYLAANAAVGIQWVYRTTWWHVEVTSVLHRDEPVGAVRVQERAQGGGLSGQPLWRSIPQHGVRLAQADVGVVYAGVD